MNLSLWDMHVHLDFMQNARETAENAAAEELGLFAVTCTPEDYIRVKPFLADAPNVRLGAGLHPWWVADGRCSRDDVFLAAELVRGTRYVGEIGLDASVKHVPEGSLTAQAEALEIICAACAETSSHASPKILSLHTVKAAGLTLDILEQTGCISSCQCIFHWFTGSSDELNRAIKAGCMFSVNEMMLRTRRGREYARQIPADRLLLETDLPPGQNVPFPASGIKASLEETLRELNAIRKADLQSCISANSLRIMLPENGS